MPYAICISRQFASLGRDIGRLVAQKLDFDYLDRDLLEKPAEILKQDLSKLAKFDEAMGSLPFAKALFPLGLGSTENRMALFNAQSALILSRVQQRSCVIVGRCADFILKDKAPVFSVFVYAPFDSRIRNATNRLQIPESAVHRHVTAIDEAREAYYRFFTQHSYDRVEDKDLCVNSDLGTLDETADLIVQAFKLKFKKV